MQKEGSEARLAESRRVVQQKVDAKVKEATADLRAELRHVRLELTTRERTCQSLTTQLKEKDAAKENIISSLGEIIEALKTEVKGLQDVNNEWSDEAKTLREEIVVLKRASEDSVNEAFARGYESGLKSVLD